MPVYHTEAGAVEILEWGEGDELLVLLHAAAAGPHSLAALATELLRPGRRIVAPALDGNGLHTHVAAARVCLAQHKVQRRLLFGHSMGGLVALLAAMAQPGFDAIVLYEPIVIGCLQDSDAALRDWDRGILAECERAIAAGAPEPGIAAFVSAWNEVAWADLPLNVRARLIEAAPRLVRDMREVSYCPLSPDQLCRVDAPVLLLQGSASPAITHAMTTRLATLLPHARRVVLEGVGHMGPLQAPAAIAGAADHFFTPSPRMN